MGNAKSSVTPSTGGMRANVDISSFESSSRPPRLGQREVVSIHIGQAGVQMGNACWELYCLEHGIQPDGYLANKDGTADGNDDAIFGETDRGKRVPRAVFVDLEPTVIDQIRGGRYRELYHPQDLISGKEDAADNYGRGHYTIGRETLGTAANRIRRLADRCNNLQGFVIYHSFGGGTGSGFTTLLAEHLQNAYSSKATIIDLGVMPSPRLSNSVVEPYNAVLSLPTISSAVDLSLCVDNEALYSICHDQLQVAAPTFLNVNRVVAQATSSATASLRFGPTGDLASLATEVVPRPGLRYPVVAYAPLCGRRNSSHEQNGAVDLVVACLDGSSQLLSCDIRDGQVVAGTALCRGQVGSTDVEAAVKMMANERGLNFAHNGRFSDFTARVNTYCQPTTVPDGDFGKIARSVCTVTNTTAISQMFDRLARAFDVIFARRAFVHWYVGEGMEESEFQLARNHVNDIVSEYQQAACQH